MDTYFSQSKPLWTPIQPQTAAVEVLRRQINRKHGLNLSKDLDNWVWILPFTITEDYHDLHRYSVEDYTFWLDLWEYLGIICSVRPQKVGQVYNVHSRKQVFWNWDTTLRIAFWSPGSCWKKFPTGFLGLDSTTRKTCWFVRTMASPLLKRQN